MSSNIYIFVLSDACILVAAFGILHTAVDNYIFVLAEKMATFTFSLPRFAIDMIILKLYSRNFSTLFSMQRFRIDIHIWYCYIKWQVHSVWCMCTPVVGN